MEDQSVNQLPNEQTDLNFNTPMPGPLQDIMKNYQNMLNTISMPSNQNVSQANLLKIVTTLHDLFKRFLLPIIAGLLDFMKAFISKIGEQDKKIAMQQENLNVQGHNLGVMMKLLDTVKTDLNAVNSDLKNTKIKFDSSMKTYHANLDRLTNEYHKNIDILAEKLITNTGQDPRKKMDEMASMMYQGGEKSRTKKHRKHRRKINK